MLDGHFFATVLRRKGQSEYNHTTPGSLDKGSSKWTYNMQLKSIYIYTLRENRSLFNRRLREVGCLEVIYLEQLSPLLIGPFQAL